MSLTGEWAQAQRQTNTLRLFLIVSWFGFIMAIIIAMMGWSRKTIIVERGCVSKIATTGPTQYTAAEVTAFVKESLSQRFDSEARPIKDFLSEEEFTKREQEQKDLSQKNIVQIIVVRSVKPSGNTATVESDRLLSVGNIRSALPFNLKLSLSSVDRDAANPYGIKLEEVQELKTASETK